MTESTPAAFDPLSPAFAADPYEAYARLREAEGLAYFAPLDMWLASRFDDVSSIVLNPNMPRMPNGILPADELERRRQQDNFHDMPHHARFVQFSMLNSDGEVHDRLRRLVFRLFTPAYVTSHRNFIQALVVGMVDRFDQNSEIEFIEDLAAAIPGHVIGHLLGVPEEDCPMLRTWSENIVQYFDIDRSADRKELAEKTTAEFADYLRDLKAERRRSPKEDLTSQLIAAQDSGLMSEDEFISTAMLILMAGHGSTIDVLGSGMHALLAFPQEMEMLRANSGLAQTAVQEMFRYECPLPFFDRYASDDVEVAGRRFPRGTRFGLLYGAANRDPAHFADANRFDISRKPNRHLAFGGGAHFCLGNHLARLDMEIVFTILLSRFSRIELTEAPEYKHSLSVRGPKALKLRLAN
ncbi:cytochrome P450 [Rhizobium sp. S-51]|uniref:Cytochrome P450 n=1 Tax=Rhizobium terricola TaxID=2728849 RepID=A0A7Y0AY69_9HYPH|nr:cytochrome P450 [Rhizobium terricola]NML75679.1 cytochrome P450 [Rhizobium terricola]